MGFFWKFEAFVRENQTRTKRKGGVTSEMFSLLLARIIHFRSEGCAFLIYIQGRLLGLGHLDRKPSTWCLIDIVIDVKVVGHLIY